MIITRIEASNILKYRRLSLNLPEQGLIAISGQNESGKSSIGETVCFALFGRTFSIGGDDLQKVVRWGDNHCAVTLHFRIADQAYVLSRFLDRDGNHSAKLSLGEADEPIARGVARVNELLVDLLGFEYEQFVESFYLAQREITTPHPHSQAVKIMAGVAPLEQVEAEILKEIKERQELLEEVQAEGEALRDELEELYIQEGYLQQLQEQQAQVQEQARQVAEQTEEIREHLRTYEVNTEQSYKAESARARAKFLRFILFLLALASGIAWWLLGPGSNTLPGKAFPGLLDQYVPQWQQLSRDWIAWAAGGFTALFLLMWIRVAGQGTRIRRLRAEAGQLLQSLQRARSFDLKVIQEVEVAAEDGERPADVEGLEDEAAESAEQAEEMLPPVPVRPDGVELEDLGERIQSGEATMRQVNKYVEPELAWLEHVQEVLHVHADELGEAITEEEERLQEQKNLLEVQDGIRENLDDLGSRIDLRRKALQLLNGAIAHLSNNFNRDIKDLVARMLPRFTGGRYEHLQIDQDLRVRIFSAEKRDFMDLEEVSSGTQRQVMLALRLALSQILLSRKIKGPQFAFLDEPFAFFDEDRTQKALAALADLGQDISQVWIVAQTFPQDTPVQFDANIVCERGMDELVLDAGGG